MKLNDVSGDVKKEKGWRHYHKLTKDQEFNQRFLPSYWAKLTQKEKVRWVSDFIQSELKKGFECVV